MNDTENIAYNNNNNNNNELLLSIAFCSVSRFGFNYSFSYYNFLL